MEEKSGFMLINKSVGPTSHDVVDDLRAITGIQKIGHAGTLDPLAEGLLILLVGDYTKRQEEFMKLPKQYNAIFVLGLDSDTHDILGKLKIKEDLEQPTRERLESVLEKFKGKIRQMPPQFSAVKVGGKKAYEEARQGKQLELEEREVEISNLEVLYYKFPLLNIEIECSSGTYVRSLARDIGNMLNTKAVMAGLKRTKIGDYNIKDSQRIKDIHKNDWQSFLLK